MATGRPGSRSGQSGFSLLALLFLLAGIGVAMAALGTMWHTAAQREKEQELLFIGEQYRQAIESFWNKSPGGVRQLPKSLEELLSDPRFPNTVRHLRRIYRDPMTGGTEWGLVKESVGGISGVYSLSEAKPFKASGFASDYEDFPKAASYQGWVFRFDYEKADKESGADAKAAPQGAAGTARDPGTSQAVK